MYILYYYKPHCLAVGIIIFRKYNKKMSTLFIDKIIKYSYNKYKSVPTTAYDCIYSPWTIATS